MRNTLRFILPDKKIEKRFFARESIKAKIDKISRFFNSFYDLLLMLFINSNNSLMIVSGDRGHPGIR
jgi:hypothetical protein